MRLHGAQWAGMLSGGAWLRHAAHANAMATRLAEGLRNIPGVRLQVEVQVNACFAEIPRAAAETLQRRGWHFYNFIGASGYRLMCSWATQPATIDRFLAELREAIEKTCTDKFV
jgi:threonine aldolase